MQPLVTAMGSVSDEKKVAFVDFERGRFVRTSALSTSSGPSSTLNAGASCEAAYFRHEAACGRHKERGRREL